MEAAVLLRVGFLAYSCPKQGQDFKPSAAPLYPNMGQVPPPGVLCMDQYTGTDTKAEDGDQDGDWTKGDEISAEDDTTKDEDIIIDDQTDKVYTCIPLS